MKRILLFLFILPAIVAVGSLFWDKYHSSAVQSVAEEKVLSAPEAQKFNQTELVWNDQNFSLAWFRANPAKLELIPNFSESLTALDALDHYQCQSLVSAGFYDSDGGPIGLFISQEKVINPYQTNQLLNGILSLNRLQTPRIAAELPKDDLVHALQSGPLILQNADIQVLSLSNDKPARRLVAAVTGANELYFIVVYRADSVYLGPFLVDLPQLIAQFSQDQELNIADAINLDGGTASAFYSPDLRLPELFRTPAPPRSSRPLPHAQCSSSYASSDL